MFGPRYGYSYGPYQSTPPQKKKMATIFVQFQMVWTIQKLNKMVAILSTI